MIEILDSIDDNAEVDTKSRSEELVALLNILVQDSAAYGLGINYNKTKVMIVDREHDDHQEINIDEL
ncbi:unnamed protein product [Callosobruchus maculatus]|uniref:Uncharacterized protein n=1 Tax=Callosobruchus maculatus TaxID=64391 RepID=A0A653CBD5_CALMS|nr:unnamed protein product [Callosobruchus maculatus]